MKNSFLKKSGLKFLLGTFVAALCMAMPTSSFAESTADLTGPIQNLADGRQVLKGYVPKEVADGTATYQYHDNQKIINGRIVMPLHNPDLLKSTLQDLQDPRSPMYHQWYTPARFVGDFGPFSADSAFVQEFLKNKGLKVTPDGILLDVTGPVAAFEQVFDTQINYYKNPDGTLYYAPKTDPILPAALKDKVLAIGGFDNLPINIVAHSDASAMDVSPSPCKQGPPGGLWIPSAIKKAYNLNYIPSDGSGQSIAILAGSGYKNTDITCYETNIGLPNVPLRNIFINDFGGSFSGTGGGSTTSDYSTEATIDIESVIGYAPGSSILVYEFNPSDNKNNNPTINWMDVWQRIASDDIAKVTSVSLGPTERNSKTLISDNEILQQMAAQGQSVFTSTGDLGDYDGYSKLTVLGLASQPYVTAVAISVLTTDSNGEWKSESASERSAGGADEIINGVPYWPIPDYQIAAATQASPKAKVSTTMRNVPDVALEAGTVKKYAYYVNDKWDGYPGSSISAPIWAAFITLVNQGLGKNGPIGLVNPALYQIAQNSSSYASDFHDITKGGNGYYPPEPGFDDASGLGSLNGYNLYYQLVNNAPSPPTGIISGPGTTNSLNINLTLSATSGSDMDTVTMMEFSNDCVTWSTPVAYETWQAWTLTDGPGPKTVCGKFEDASGHWSGAIASNTITFIPPLMANPPPPPTAPTNLKAQITSSGVMLTWEFNANIVGFNVFRNGSLVATVANPPNAYWIDTTANLNQTNSYQVSGYTARGSTSMLSNTATV